VAIATLSVSVAEKQVVQESTTTFTSSILDLSISLNTASDNMTVQVDGVENTDVEFYPEMRDATYTFDKLATKLVDAGYLIVEVTGYTGDARQVVSIIYLTLICISFVCGLTAIKWNTHNFRFTSIYVLFVVMSLAWISAAINITFGQFSSDTCIVIRASDELKSVNDALLLNCISDEQFMTLQSAFGNYVDELFAGANTLARRMDLPPIETELPTDANETALEGFVSWSKFMTSELAEASDNLAACTNCPAALSEDLSSYLNDLSRLLVLLSIIIYLLSCEYLGSFIGNIKASLCQGKVEDSSQTISGIALFHGILMMVIILLTFKLVFEVYKAPPKNKKVDDEAQETELESPSGINPSLQQSSPTKDEFKSSSDLA
jgi:hypothetical protein